MLEVGDLHVAVGSERVGWITSLDGRYVHIPFAVRRYIYMPVLNENAAVVPVDLDVRKWRHGEPRFYQSAS